MYQQLPVKVPARLKVRRILKNATFMGFFIGLFVFIIFAILYHFNVLGKVEDLTLKSRFLLSNSSPSDQCVVVAIDKDSMKEIGQWPWSRKYHAKMTEALNFYGAKAIVYDVFFMFKNEKDPAGDRAFIEALRHYKNVTIGTTVYWESKDVYKQYTQEERNKLKTLTLSSPGNLDYITASQLGGTIGEDKQELSEAYAVLPFEGLLESVNSMGMVAQRSRDSLYQMTPMIIKIKDYYFPSLSLAAYLHVNNIKEIKQAPHALKVGKKKIPVMQNNLFFINWYSSPGQPYMYRTIPFYQMLQAYSALEDKSEKLGVSKEELQNKLDQYYVCNDTCPDDIKKVYNDLFADDWVVQSKHFKDKYVFIGMTDTSTGTKDLIKTPVHDLLPGVFLHANVMDNILQDDFIRKTTDVSVLLVLFVLCIATGLTLLGVKNPQMGIGLSLLYVLYFVIPFILFLYFQVYTDIVYTELAIITVFILGLCYQWILVDRDKREIRKVFSNYLAPQILNEVLSDTANLDLGGNKKEITVLFSDIRGFTTLSESRSPEEVVLFLNEFFDAMVEEIMRYEGTLDKFIGDAIMAFWGAPLENENHAELAAKAALAMIARLEALKKKWIEEGKDYPEINIGIGLNTGEALVGHVGATKIKSYTVIGDTVNLASRLEGLNKQYAMYEGKDIIISEYTFEQIKDKFDAYYLEEVKVKGKDHAVKIYKLQ